MSLSEIVAESQLLRDKPAKKSSWHVSSSDLFGGMLRALLVKSTGPYTLCTAQPRRSNRVWCMLRGFNSTLALVVRKD